MSVSTKSFKTKKDLTPYEKAYWYLRLFVNSDRYGNFAKSKKKLAALSADLEKTYDCVATNSGYTLEEKIEILSKMLRTSILDNTREGTKKYDQYLDLIDELKSFLFTLKDYETFIITLKDVLIATNNAIDEAPNSQEVVEFVTKFATALLDTQKEKGLSNLIRDWDVITEDICLNKERDIIVEVYKSIKDRLLDKHSEANVDLILTAVCQEFERRIGQKRKQRSGADLESATKFIFDYFQIPCADGPEHFNAGIEVDNWVKDKSGWYIGISLKRTLRERWKQTNTSRDELTGFKIKNIVHLINNDSDLSETKIAEMGSKRHLFFLADNSKILTNHLNHAVLNDYVFPMSSFIKEINFLRNN